MAQILSLLRKLINCQHSRATTEKVQNATKYDRARKAVSGLITTDHGLSQTLYSGVELTTSTGSLYFNSDVPVELICLNEGEDYQPIQIPSTTDDTAAYLVTQACELIKNI